MAQPGTLDFAALAKQATASLTKSESVAPAGKVKIAATEGGVPAPQHAVIDDTRGDDWNDDNQVGDPEVPEIIENNVENAAAPREEVAGSTESKSQEELEDEIKELPDDHKVRVKIDGEVQVITHGEYKDIIRKNATVTQRMQAFAKSRDEFNAEVQNTLAILQQREQAILAAQQAPKDPLSEALIAALKGQVAPKPRDPNEIVTLADVQAEREKLLAEFTSTRQNDRAEFENALRQAAQNVQNSAQATRERQEYLTGLNGILNDDKFKVLSEVIPNLQANTMFHVQSMGPKNLEEALEFSKDYIKDRYKVFAKHTTAAQQKQQSKAAQQKMEPADGATPTITKGEQSQRKVFVGKNGKLDFNAMKQDALARINSMA